MRNGFAKTDDLIKMFNVSPGTITNMIKQLKTEGLVIHQPYKDVKLTEKGREIAIQAVRRRRIVE
ncbi:TPA: metal-dependent transcriptional regulator [Candidatus Bathyarchaeota archaeon]|nr:metal-dependent transcriptional regulator [Candidatus Bathyarchaeota archaeon]